MHALRPSVIAVRFASSKLVASNGELLAVAINKVLKDASTIATGNALTDNARLH